MNQRVGSCSICGGDVTGFRGPWMGVTPPPPDECSQCGAVAGADVIRMTPRPGASPTRTVYGGTLTDITWGFW